MNKGMSQKFLVMIIIALIFLVILITRFAALRQMGVGLLEWIENQLEGVMNILG
jgi:hypothetical protein